MNEQNNIKLAIGYGLGIGMILAGIFVSAGYIISSLFNIRAGMIITIAVILLGGLVIAIYNAIKMDKNVVSAVEGSSE